MRSGFESWQVRSEDFPIAGTDGEKLQFLVNYAVLAPSKYNVQPWLFELCGDSLDVICDRSWAVREADPRGRELRLSCGAALQNLLIAARHFRLTPLVETFPWPGDRHLLARVRLNPARAGSGPSKPILSDKAHERRGGGEPGTKGLNEILFKAMKRRCTSRRPFGRSRPTADVLDTCSRAVSQPSVWLQWIEDEPSRRAVARLVARGDREQMGNRTLRREIARWLRPASGGTKDGFPASRFGLRGAVDWLTPGFSAALWAFNLGGVVAARDSRLVRTGPILAVLGTDADEPEAWLRAGQALQSFLLQATAAGLSVSFFNQPVELDHLRKDLGTLIGRKGFPQVLLRLGYAKRGRHTPRRPASEVVI